MSEGSVPCRIEDGVAWITFDRPAAHNAMTWSMYAQLVEACRRIGGDPSVRVAVLRGAGGRAFVAGTDIAQFQAFRSGEDGVDYERRIEEVIGALEAVPVPTLAVVEGWAIGGGLVIAAACDLRIATPGSKFGVPIARTLGNCLSTANLARMAAAIGVARTKRMIMLAENVTAEEALATGFVTEIAPAEQLDARVAALCGKLRGHAPVTLRVTKEALRRIQAAGVPAGDDLVRECYGSADFRNAVQAFVAKRPAEWSGR